MKKLLCRILGHRLTLDMKRRVDMLGFDPWRLRCVRCGVADPYQNQSRSAVRVEESP